ncbi:Transcription factor [Cladobotryum mycophilum]|uniref:Transcription factor n=1 Tax=Cladobotryum mycophilum TaxID=491253 RepID=A0ABR0SDU1_9HYPO
MPRSSLAHILEPPRPIAHHPSPDQPPPPGSATVQRPLPLSAPAPAPVSAPVSAPAPASAPALALVSAPVSTNFIAYEPNLPIQPRTRAVVTVPSSLPPSSSLTEVPAVTSGLPITNFRIETLSSRRVPKIGLHACEFCPRTYSRPEHLVRHVQTHTLGRRFFCDICQKAFARKDLLTRHVANHQNDSPNKRRRITSSTDAVRVSQACRSCASARVKCDDKKPCRRCVDRQLTCVSPSEPGSVAAVHQAHSQAQTLTNLISTSNSRLHSLPVPNNSSVASTSRESTSSCSPTSHDQPRSVPGSSASTAHDTTNKTTPASQSTPTKSEGSQLSSPEEVKNDNNSQANTVEVNHVPFFDFLREMLYQQPFDQTKLANPEGMDVLNFCDNANMELTDMDFGLLDFWNLDALNVGTMPMEMEVVGPLAQNTIDISQMRENLVNVWTKSPWRWDPAHHDSGYKEQGNLPVSATDAARIQLEERRKGIERVIDEKLNQSSRDQVLTVLLSTCHQSGTAGRVAASFPSVEVMDTMVHIFLAAHGCQVSAWIHFPTFTLNTQWPEWIGVAAAAGAVLTPVPTLRKFGFAVQEAVRITIPARFEHNNTAIQNLSLVQALVLGQDLGLWSGNRRKMEIAECHLVIPVTMMRYRRKFQRSSYPIVIVDPSDDGEVLEEKWRFWVEMEQWKRLVFHCYIREAQISMTTLTNTCMAYSEITLPLPEPRELWFAKSAAEWKAQYLERSIELSRTAPSMGDFLFDVKRFLDNYTRLDLQLSISIYLHGYWSLILSYRQLSAVSNFRSYTQGTENLVLSARHQELVTVLQTFQLMSLDWPSVSAQEHLLCNLLLMNLHVSLDDLQLFSGKDGEDEARRIYPILQEWVSSSDARSAVWYAGQVLRYAKQFPPGHLKDFNAVAVHHASLALWTYGVVSRANRRDAIAIQAGYRPFYLDGANVAASQRFIGSQQGRPLIQGPEVEGGAAAEASLYDPRACMDIAHEILQSNFRTAQEALPPIVENLCQLITQLGNAAWAVGLS